MGRIDDIMFGDITCEDLHLASVAGMDDIFFSGIGSSIKESQSGTVQKNTRGIPQDIQ